MVFLNGDAIPEPDDLGRRITDDHFLLMFNASAESITFTTPPKAFGETWTVRLNTATGDVDPRRQAVALPHQARGAVALDGRAVHRGRAQRGARGGRVAAPTGPGPRYARVSGQA